MFQRKTPSVVRRVLRASCQCSLAVAAIFPAIAISTTPPTPDAGSGMARDVAAFVPSGMKVVQAVHGDLTGQETADVLLVLSPASTKEEKLGQGPPRTVVLLVKNAGGPLRELARNNRIVPCEHCGGLAGDPYAFSRVEHGHFTVSISGGSRERWADDFTFHYVRDRQDWRLEKVVRELSDSETGQHRKLELSPGDFGQISFAQFDPAVLARPAPLAFPE